VASHTYLNACRLKRNKAEYDRIGVVSQDEAEELIGFVREFLDEALAWLRARHPELF